MGFFDDIGFAISDAISAVGDKIGDVITEVDDVTCGAVTDTMFAGMAAVEAACDKGQEATLNKIDQLEAASKGDPMAIASAAAGLFLPKSPIPGVPGINTVVEGIVDSVRKG